MEQNIENLPRKWAIPGIFNGSENEPTSMQTAHAASLLFNSVDDDSSDALFAFCDGIDINNAFKPFGKRIKR